MKTVTVPVEETVDLEKVYDRCKSLLRSGEMKVDNLEIIHQWIFKVIFADNPAFIDLVEELIARTKEENGKSKGQEC
jgi:hypothetical protein